MSGNDPTVRVDSGHPPVGWPIDHGCLQARILTPEEARALFDRQARRYLGISGEGFLRRWDAGEVHWDDSPEVSRVAMLVPFGR